MSQVCQAESETLHSFYKAACTRPFAYKSISALARVLGNSRQTDKPTFINIQKSKSLSFKHQPPAPNHNEHFYIPKEVYDFFMDVPGPSDVYEGDWETSLKRYEELYPALAIEFRRHVSSTKSCGLKENVTSQKLVQTSNTTSPNSTTSLPPPERLTHENHSQSRSPSGKRKHTEVGEGARQIACLPSRRPADPNTFYIRPCDPEEVAGAFLIAMKPSRMTTMISLPQHVMASYPQNASRIGVTLGAYVFAEVEGENFDVTLIGVGSEMPYTVGTRSFLGETYGIKARVVSCPCLGLFAQQPQDYQLSVLKKGRGKPVVVIDVADSSINWEQYADVLVALKQVWRSRLNKSRQTLLCNQPSEIGPKIKVFIDEFRGNRD